MNQDHRQPPCSDDDATVVRARDAAAPDMDVTSPDRAPAVPSAATPVSEPVAIEGFLHGGLNTLVQAASPLLLLAVQLRHSSTPPHDVGYLRTQAAQRIRQFESQAYADGANTQTVIAARYVLCTMVDESVSNSPWGDVTGWSQRTLLVTFHGETYGGAKFFQILDRLAADFSRHLDLLELMYVCLALGFGGRYLVEPGGQGRLADIQDDLYRRIRALRDAPAAELSPHWQGADMSGTRAWRYLPLWLLAAAAACVLLATFVFFFTRLNTDGAQVSAQLAAIGVRDAAPPHEAPRPVRKTLKQLLAPEARAGKLSVVETAEDEDIVRLAASGLFPSGGTDIDPGEVPLLHRITWALNQLPGRVVVVGHTDDQPVRSLKFKNNFELSEARARSTMAILRQGLNDPGRLEASGAGSSQPIALPPQLPANRARNRRVEIIYRAED